MTGNQIRETYLKYMEARGHTVIPSSALVPENDPTTLFTGSGMQPLLPYLMGEKHPMGTRLTDSQKCFRAEDIEEVGDNRHTTFFEMLGNWSLGDYFKEEQLPWFFSFLVDAVGLNPKNLYVTAFIGDDTNGIPKDTTSTAIWERLFTERDIDAAIVEIGSEKDGYVKGMQGGRIFYYDAAKNWWSRAGKPEKMPAGEPGGPDSEVFYDFGTPHDSRFGEHCHPNCDCGRFLEIGNSVFMEYVKNSDGTFSKLPQQNVDFGGGLERITAARNNDADVFTTDLFAPIIKRIETLSGKTYRENLLPFRVIVDHIRGAVFMIGDGVHPGNTEQPYFVRRLLRRAVRYADILGIPEGELTHLGESVIELYSNHYINLEEKRAEIVTAIAEEETRFRKTLARGLKEFEKHAADGSISGNDAFILFTTYGFPLELTLELATERGIPVDQQGFREEMKKHQESSRAGAEQKFKGGLADHSEKVVHYHTATHLLLAGLRKELGSHVHQAGSNITGERLRFDFTHPSKVEREVLERVETYVNNAITAGASVTIETIPKSIAEKDSTVEGSFWERYPDEVKIYTVKGKDGTVYSRELCGGPHVENTGSISGIFKITKEEAVASGVRRVKAVLE